MVVQTKYVEDSWAVELMKFNIGANQLMYEGLTHELEGKSVSFSS